MGGLVESEARTLLLKRALRLLASRLTIIENQRQTIDNRTHKIDKRFWDAVVGGVGAALSHPSPSLPLVSANEREDIVQFWIQIVDISNPVQNNCQPNNCQLVDNSNHSPLPSPALPPWRLTLQSVTLKDKNVQPKYTKVQPKYKKVQRGYSHYSCKVQLLSERDRVIRTITLPRRRPSPPGLLLWHVQRHKKVQNKTQEDTVMPARIRFDVWGYKKVPFPGTGGEKAASLLLDMATILAVDTVQELVCGVPTNCSTLYLQSPKRVYELEVQLVYTGPLHIQSVPNPYHSVPVVKSKEERSAALVKFFCRNHRLLGDCKLATDNEDSEAIHSKACGIM